MDQTEADTRYLMDRAAIHDLHVRYFQGLDRCSYAQVRGCFTDDIRAHYDSRPAISGIDDLMGGFRSFKRMAEGRMKITTHFMGNLNHGLIEGDTAETEVNAIAFLVEPTDQVAMRSLRYIDRLRRTREGWRISNRIQTLDWSCQMPADYAVAFARRVTALPAD